MHREQLTAALDARLSTATTAHWLSRLQGLLPAAPVYDLPQALDNPYIREIGMLRDLPHPLRPDYRVLANPIKLDGERVPSRIAPGLGEHTEPLLRELGYSTTEINGLREQGVT